MSGKKSRDKGQRGEREVAKLFRRWFPNAKRSHGQVREGYELPDITGDHLEDVIYLEVKFWDRFTSNDRKQCWKKAKEDCKLYGKPIPIFMIWRETGQRDWKVTTDPYGLRFLGCHVADNKSIIFDISWTDFEKLFSEQLNTIMDMIERTQRNVKEICTLAKTRRSGPLKTKTRRIKLQGNRKKTQ